MELHDCDFKREAEELRSLVEDLRVELSSARVEIAELKARVGQNPRNSSVPPSSEGYEKPPTRQQRRASERAAGKQRGTPGHRLEPVVDPDEVIPLDPDCCSSCGGSLDDADDECEEIRQVFDLPERRLRVREYRARTRLCSCGVKTKASFPKEAIASSCLCFLFI